MASSIKDFLANFAQGGLRPNRYRVNLTFPGVQNARKLSFTCRSSAVPSSELGTASAHFMGRELKMAGDKTWNDWNVTIYLDNDLVGRKSFEKWHNDILQFDANTANLMEPSSYYGSGTVQLLDRRESVLEVYEVELMYPTSVGEISLAYDSNDQIAEQQVTFAINGWKSSQTS